NGTTRFGVSDFQRRAWKAPASLGDHVFRNVDPDRVGAARRGFRCDVGGSRRHVQQLGPGADLHGIEKPINSVMRHLASKGIVMLSLSVPCGLLKLLEGVALLFTDSHRAP